MGDAVDGSNLGGVGPHAEEQSSVTAAWRAPAGFGQSAVCIRL